MSFYVYSGNRTEVLAEALAKEFYAAPGRDIFEPVKVVVLSLGMADFVRAGIARHCGTAVNLELPFLTRFIQRTLRDNLPDMGKYGAFEPGGLRWRIFRILRDAPERYPEPARYWQDADGSDEKLFDLSSRLAELFDHYQHYAPELLKRWRREGNGAEKTANVPSPEGTAAGDEGAAAQSSAAAERWEKRLYLELRQTGLRSADEWFEKFFALEKLAFKPRSVAIFGVSSMPEIFLDFFCRLSTECDVHLFFANYCRAHWGDIFTLEDRRRIEIEAKRNGEEPEMPESENPLLENFGGTGRDFFRALLDRSDRVEMIYRDLHTGVDTPGALGELQRGVLDMLPGAVHRRDWTISIHNCRGRRREAELVHDQLLKAVEEGVEPREIMVMTPDIGGYAPYISAVFSGGPLADSYRISDRTAKDDNAVSDTFFKMLSLVRSRCESSRVFEIFSAPAVAEKFAFSGDDLETLRTFLVRGNYRWGENAEMHRAFCQVPFEGYSYERARDRILSGYAMGSDAEYDDPPGLPFFSGGGEALLAGRFFAAADRLFSLLGKLRSDRKSPPGYFLDIFGAMLDEFFSGGENFFREAASLRRSLDQLRDELESSGFDIPVSFDVMASALESFQSMENSSVFLRGKITFCSLKPMRSIPCKVLAVMGLAEGMFPRRDREGTLNLTALGGGRITRSAVREDRFLFLEAVMSARQKLILSYPGMNESDDAELPPAPPLFELMQMTPDSPVLEHFLHGNDLRYFLASEREKGYFTYSESDYEGALALRDGKKLRRDVPEEPPPMPSLFPYPETRSELPAHLELTALQRFFHNPAAHFLANRAMLSMYSNDEAAFSDREPMALDKLEEYTARRKLFELRARGLDIERVRKHLIHGDLLPPGRAGETLFDTLAQMDEDRVRLYLQLRDEAVKTAFSHRMLSGVCETAGRGDGDRFCFLFSQSRFRAKDYVSLLLASALAAAGDGVLTGALFSSDQMTVCRFASAQEAEAYLDMMLEYYRGGQDEILYFLPASLFNFMREGKREFAPGENDRGIFREDDFFSLPVLLLGKRIFRLQYPVIEQHPLPSGADTLREILLRPGDAEPEKEA